MSVAELTNKLEQGRKFEDDEKSADAIGLYEAIISYKFKNDDEINDASVRAKEQSAYRLANIFLQLSLFDELVDLTK